MKDFFLDSELVLIHFSSSELTSSCLQLNFSIRRLSQGYYSNIVSRGACFNSLQRRGEALRVNISAGEGLQDVLKSNLGPLGTIKMYLHPTIVYFCRLQTAGLWMEQAQFVEPSAARVL